MILIYVFFKICRDMLPAITTIKFILMSLHLPGLRIKNNGFNFTGTLNYVDKTLPTHISLTKSLINEGIKVKKIRERERD